MDLSTRCTFHIIRHAQSLFLLSNLLCNTLGWIAKLIEQRGVVYVCKSRGPGLIIDNAQCGYRPVKSYRDPNQTFITLLRYTAENGVG